MRVAVVCDWFFFLDGTRLGAGGVESYLQNLVDVVRDQGHVVSVFQRGKVRFKKDWNGVDVVSWTTLEEQRELLRQFHGAENGPTVYSDFHITPARLSRPAVFIQHGIYWDVPHRRFRNKALQGALNLKKGISAVLRSRRLLRVIKQCAAVITVDVNFQNWMRTLCGWHNFESTWEYIPNCAKPVSLERVQAKLRATHQLKRVLFARRFEEFRGTDLWANVVRCLAVEKRDVEFVFCGHGAITGRTEHALRAKLQGLDNVRIYERPYSEMMTEHFDADIEVVPSLGSEGTSFSLIEAMAAGTCVVASAVGGLANVIIPGYNGVLIQPTERAFLTKVRALLDDPSTARQLAGRGYETAVEALSLSLWRKRVGSVLSHAFVERSKTNLAQVR